MVLGRRPKPITGEFPGKNPQREGRSSPDVGRGEIVVLGGRLCFENTDLERPLAKGFAGRDMVHRRQFIIGPEAAAPADGWRVVALEGGWTLAHCPTLPAHTVADRAGTSWTLLGLCWETDPSRPAPMAAIAAHRDGAIEDLYRSWVGRWVLIGRNEVHLDPAGMLGVLYLDHSVAASSGVCISSSAALLSRALKPGVRPTFEIAHGRGMDWYPPPGARLPGLRRLLPTQILLMDRLVAGAPYVRPRTFRIEAAPADHEALVEELRRYLVDAIRAVAAGRDRLYLPLTAGQDSRLILAAAHAAGVAVETYTFAMTWRWHGVALTRADREIPPRLAEVVGAAHHLIRGRPPDAARLAAWRSHTGGHSAGVDEHQIATGQWDALPTGALVLRGGVFELGRCFYYKRLPELRTANDPDAVAKMVDRFGLARHFASITQHTAALREWLEWCKAHPIERFDIRDRLYLEQRLAAWLSSIEQGLDIMTAERVHIANSYRYFASVLSLPESVRASGRHHRELIGKMAPALAAFPFNPRQSRARQVIRRLRYVQPNRRFVLWFGTRMRRWFEAQRAARN
jgi:hypothetical protein